MVLKKLILAIVIVAVIYLVFFQGLGSLAGNALQQLDRKYISGDSVLPDPDELRFYQNALVEFKEQNTGTAAELADIRLKAVEIALQSQEVEKQIRLVDFQELDCETSTEFQNALRLLEDNKTKARNAVSKIEQFKKANGTDAALENLEQTLKAFITGFEVQKQQLENYC